jgi:hypothetical protein
VGKIEENSSFCEKICENCELWGKKKKNLFLRQKMKEFVGAIYTFSEKYPEK